MEVVRFNLLFDAFIPILVEYLSSAYHSPGSVLSRGCGTEQSSSGGMCCSVSREKRTFRKRLKIKCNDY